MSLSILPADARIGLGGAALAIVNPPWQLDAQLGELLPQLHKLLSPEGLGGSSVGWIVPEQSALGCRLISNAAHTVEIAVLCPKRSPVGVRLWPALCCRPWARPCSVKVLQRQWPTARTGRRPDPGA